MKNTPKMRRVTKEEFFAFVGPRDTMPTTDESTLRDVQIVSHWHENPGRKLVGMSKSNPRTCINKYYLMEKT